MTDANLNDVFEDDKAEVTETEEVAAKDEPEAKEAEAEEVEVEDAEPTAAKDKDEPQEWTKKAALDERRKRQSAEAEAQSLKEELARLKSGKQETGEEEQSAEQSPEDLEWKIVLRFDQKRMAKEHEDYSEMETVFVDLANKSPALREQLRKAEFPAEFAYQTAKEHTEFLEFKASKDTEEYKEFLEFKKTKGERKEETPQDKRKASAVKVPDLTKAAAKGRNSEEPESPGDLKSIMADAPF